MHNRPQTLFSVAIVLDFVFTTLVIPMDKYITVLVDQFRDS